MVAQDIYNIRKELCWENLKGKRPIEALLEELQKGQYIFHYKTDSINRITHLFFAHPKSVEMLNLYPDLVLLDCTYKTNRFKLPLLNIVGSTCLNTTFYIAFYFFKYEDKESYVWALSYVKSLYNSSLPKALVMDRDMALLGASRTVFPEAGRILCIWHVEKNVLIYVCREIREKEAQEEFMKKWMLMISSSTEEVYQKNWEDLQETYKQFPILLSYIQNTWLEPWKKLLVRAWVDQLPHFENRASSQVEGGHSTLKSYLQVSTGDLKMVYDRITLLLNNRFSEFYAAIENNKIRIPHTARDPFYALLLGWVSSFALGQLWYQRQRINTSDPLLPCTGTFWELMGMPCAHDIQDQLQRNDVLQLSDIHQHWYLDPTSIPTTEIVIRDPALPPPCRSQALKSSTRRDPCAFELAIRPQAQRSQQADSSVSSALQTRSQTQAQAQEQALQVQSSIPSAPQTRSRA